MIEGPGVQENHCFVFDENEKFTKARGTVKYLVADGKFDYLETGSLISIHEAF